jgi:integrase
MDISKKIIRRQIEPGSKLYTHKLQSGLHLGFRKGKTGSYWTIKLHVDGWKYRYWALSEADDTEPADGKCVLSFSQAATKAREWWAKEEAIRKGEVLPGFYTVAMAMRDYLADQEARKGAIACLAITRLSVAKHVTNSSIGGIHLPDLKHFHIDAWFNALGALRRPRKGSSEAQDIQRAQSTANRTYTNLKSGLNFAFRKGRVSTKPWERVKPHKGVDVARERHLELDECKRLIECRPGDFKLMIQAALDSGARYGQICALKVGDYYADTNRLHIAKPAHSKSKGRYIGLTVDAGAFFAGVCAGREAEEPMFIHTTGMFKGKPWKHGQERSPMRVACKAAKITPAIGYHILRHTVASHLAMAGTPMPVIARMLGHSSARIVELHYGHLSETYASDQLPTNMPSEFTACMSLH